MNINWTYVILAIGVVIGLGMAISFVVQRAEIAQVRALCDSESAQFDYQFNAYRCGYEFEAKGSRWVSCETSLAFKTNCVVLGQEPSLVSDVNLVPWQARIASDYIRSRGTTPPVDVSVKRELGGQE